MKSERIKRYYANGKLLISGEYLVLSGAQALAVPVKKGQWLEVETIREEGKPFLKWQAWVLDREWFNATILPDDLEILQSSDPLIASRLVKIFNAILELNPGVFAAGAGYSFSTMSTFDHNWGMGSSSALIANLARWAGIDPFKLFYRLYTGSGFDVAAALAEGPILFTKGGQTASIIPVKFMPAFHPHLWFVYRGQKQNTERSLYEFSRITGPSTQQIELMNYFTGELLHSRHLENFMIIMAEHESLISRLLGRKPVKEEHFSDFKGEIKSLGAWGGDMIMVASQMPGEYIHDYFRTKGIQIVFDFQSLILS